MTNPARRPQSLPADASHRRDRRAGRSTRGAATSLSSVCHVMLSPSRLRRGLPRRDGRCSPRRHTGMQVHSRSAVAGRGEQLRTLWQIGCLQRSAGVSAAVRSVSRPGRPTQLWSGESGVRHHLGVQQPASFPLVARRWAWLWIATTVYCAFRFVHFLRDGRVPVAVYWAITGLVGIHLFVRSLRSERQLAPDQLRRRALIGALQLIIFSLAVATVAAVRAVQVSGGARIFAIIVAVAFYGLSVRLTIKTLVGRRQSADAADTPSVDKDGSDPGASSADSQQER